MRPARIKICVKAIVRQMTMMMAEEVYAAFRVYLELSHPGSQLAFPTTPERWRAEGQNLCSEEGGLVPIVARWQDTTLQLGHMVLARDSVLGPGEGTSPNPPVP